MKSILKLFIFLAILISINLQLAAQDSLLTKVYVDTDSLYGNTAVYLSITNITDNTLLVPWPYSDEYNDAGSQLDLKYNSIDVYILAFANFNGNYYVNLAPQDSTRIRIEFNNLSNGIPMDTTDHTFTFKTFPKGAYSGTVKGLKQVQGEVYLYRIFDDNNEHVVSSLIDSLNIPVMRKFIIRNSLDDYELLFDTNERFIQFDSLLHQRVRVYRSTLLDGTSNIRFRVEYFNSKPVWVDVDEEKSLPKNFQIERIYPNPFNPSTTVNLDVLDASRYELRVYNTLGRQIYSQQLGILNAGMHPIALDLSNTRSGVYFLKITDTNTNQYSIRKITLLK